MTALELFHLDSPAKATAHLLACCGSERWASRLVAGRPYASAEALIAAGEAVWLALDEADWLAAFACHPRIGEKTQDAGSAFERSSSVEQEAAQKTLAEVADALVRGNRAYEARFGFRYIVFASGRTAPELLGVLEERLSHTRAEELQEAARQQLQITNLRMRKWLHV